MLPRLAGPMRLLAHSMPSSRSACLTKSALPTECIRSLSTVPVHIQEWIESCPKDLGTKHDTLDRKQMALDSLTFNKDTVPDLLPPCRHWMYFLPQHGGRTDTLNADGHDAGRTPPEPFVTRMWAGGDIFFEKPIALDTQASMSIEIDKCNFKSGRSGDLLFVTHKNTVFDHERNPAIIDFQNFVYRTHDASKTGAVDPSTADVTPFTLPDDARWSVPLSANEIVLFRYSALTFNSHRIHYDINYCTKQEGFPNVVVHGPLLCTMMCDAVEDLENRQVGRISYRAVSPLYMNEDAVVWAKPMEPAANGRQRLLVSVTNASNGVTCMEGAVELI